jgi:hypothetical protein
MSPRVAQKREANVQRQKIIGAYGEKETSVTE